TGPIINKCSQIVSDSKSASSSGRTPILFLTSRGELTTERPLMKTSPLLGRNIPVSILTVVDLPEPLGHRKPNNVPCGIRNSRLRTATRSPNVLDSLCVSISNIVTALRIQGRELSNNTALVPECYESAESMVSMFERLSMTQWSLKRVLVK